MSERPSDRDVACDKLSMLLVGAAAIVEAVRAEDSHLRMRLTTAERIVEEDKLEIATLKKSWEYCRRTLDVVDGVAKADKGEIANLKLRLNDAEVLNKRIAAQLDGFRELEARGNTVSGYGRAGYFPQYFTTGTYNVPPFVSPEGKADEVIKAAYVKLLKDKDAAIDAAAVRIKWFMDKVAGLEEQARIHKSKPQEFKPVTGMTYRFFPKRAQVGNREYDDFSSPVEVFLTF